MPVRSASARAIGSSMEKVSEENRQPQQEAGDDNGKTRAFAEDRAETAGRFVRRSAFHHTHTPMMDAKAMTTPIFPATIPTDVVSSTA